MSAHQLWLKLQWDAPETARIESQVPTKDEQLTVDLTVVVRWSYQYASRKLKICKVKVLFDNANLLHDTTAEVIPPLELESPRDDGAKGRILRLTFDLKRCQCKEVSVELLKQEGMRIELP